MNDRAEPDLDPALSRRDFLIGTTAAAGAALGSRAWSAVEPADSPATAASQPARPLVVFARSDYVVEGQQVHPRILAEMFDWGLRRVTSAPTAGQAWRRLLKPQDVVGLKFNRSGAKGLGTTPPFAEVVIRSLVDAGWDPKQIVPIEVPPSIYETTDTTRPRSDWDAEPVDFGSGSDRLAGLLRQVNAIINIPFLKTHNIARMTCCLKNLSHALVKHPARFHANHCSPYVGDIVALPQIRKKVKLNVVNALRVVFDRGPEAQDEYTCGVGAILLGTDPVAVDTVGLECLNRERKSRSLLYIDSGGASVEHLEAAAARGLGCGELFKIEVVKKSL